MRRGPKPAKSREAKPPVASQSPKNEDSKVRVLEKRLAEAQEQLQTRDRELAEAREQLTAAHAQISESHEQQTATSEILRVITSSPTAELQPVLDAMAESAARVCSAYDASIFQLGGDVLRLVAHHGPVLVPPGFVMPAVRGLVGGRTVLDRQPIQVADLQTQTEEFPEGSAIAREHGFHTLLSVPLLSEGTGIGIIALRRIDVQPFTETQIALLQTFADQAVIAIENVRLFNETKEALEQQTATSEILGVISQSPTNVQPVFDTIAARAKRLCDARECAVFRFDGELIHLVAQADTDAAWANALRSAFPRPPGQGSITARAIQTRSLVHIPDVQADPEFELTEAARASSVRSTLSVPMIREGEVIGAITVDRREPKPFLDKQIRLVKSFADQAVIAIENVRLFTELQARNRDLTTALDEKTATSEILRVISQSPTDVQPVFDSIIASAVRLLAADNGVLTRIVGDNFELAAFTGTGGAGDAALRAAFPWSLQAEGAHTKVVRNRTSINIADARTDPGVSETRRALARVLGYQSLAVVPLLRRGEALGTIAVTRREPGGFTDDEIALLKTFAHQAVIAIENVRLFTELQARNREIEDKSRQLEVASQHKSEFLANMSHELRTPLNAIIGFSEVLSDRMFGELNEKQDEYLKDIYASGTHLLSLINDILDLSKIEAGRMELELSGFHLPTALDNALTLVRERAGRRSITLQTGIDERLGEVRADERKIRQVVLNLLSNAIKFTPEGGRIEVAAVPKDGSVEVSVNDTGVGIAPEDQEAVFEEFRQVGTADKKAEGTGLGLTLCRKFIELHGGRIWVTSQVGVGSTFTFTIPVLRGE